MVAPAVAVNSNETYCTFTLPSDVTAGGLPSETDIAKDLESNDDEVKKLALRAAIMAMLGGEAMPSILMQVIRFCINSNDKQLKKLCMLYWEVVPKYQEPTSEELLAAATGGPAIQRKMLPQMLLVCNALMNDLNHPNEYVRGAMLRFLCKVKDEEILGPLIPSIKSCLEHRHAYVRKNAALAIFHAHKLFGENLIPDGPEMIAQFLESENDVSCRRNAFLMLFNENEELAIEFLAKNINEVNQFGDGFMLLVLELTRRVCRRDPTQKSRFVRVLFQMLSSTSSAVSYEASWTLISLSNAPTAVRAAAVTYSNLLNGQNDNNVKLIVLERLEGLKVKHPKILQELVMDILRALSSPNPDICTKVLQVTMDAVTGRNVQEVVNVLKREVQKSIANEETNNIPSGGGVGGGMMMMMSSNSGSEVKGSEYRNMLIKAIHGCASRFPNVAESVVHTLMDTLGTDSGLQVILFLRAIIEQYAELRAPLITKLISSLNDVTSNQVLCVCLWILGEYTETAETIQDAFHTIVEEAGEPPFIIQSKEKDDADKAAAGGGDASDAPKIVTKNVVLSDGTYATQTVYSEVKTPVTDSTPPLRRMLIGGDVFLGEVLSSAITKMCLRATDMIATSNGGGGDNNNTVLTSIIVKEMTMKSLFIMCGVVKMAECTIAAQRSSFTDCQERLTLCCRSLLDPQIQALMKPTLLLQGKERFAQFLKIVKEKEIASKDTSHKDTSNSTSSNTDEKNKKKNDTTTAADNNNKFTSQADDLIHFRQLRSMAVQGGSDVDLDDGSDLARATGYDSADSLLSSELKHVYQLSGFADPVYAEALVTVHDYDIVLEILLINRTSTTLANLTVELSTMGDMKIVERPQSNTLGPLDQITIRASIKVSSTETGHIFGTIVYDDTSINEKRYINLNDIHMDIMDYIRPATCTDEQFRSMWAEFEWENKVAISTNIISLLDFLHHIVSSTNMRCLTPHDKTEKGSFLAANLYARSVFGEDALVNVSVEKKDDNDGKLAGYIRIRSKTQGIALSLGDRITSVQRGLPENGNHTAASSTNNNNNTATTTTSGGGGGGGVETEDTVNAKQ